MVLQKSEVFKEALRLLPPFRWRIASIFRYVQVVHLSNPIADLGTATALGPNHRKTT